MDKFFIGIDNNIYASTTDPRPLIDLNIYNVTSLDQKKHVVNRDAIKMFFLYDSKENALLLWTHDNAPKKMQLSEPEYNNFYKSLQKAVTGRIEPNSADVVSINIPAAEDDDVAKNEYTAPIDETQTDLYQAEDDDHFLGAYQHDYYVWFSKDDFWWGLTKETPAPIDPEGNLRISLDKIDTSKAALMTQEELHEALEGGKVYCYMQVNRLLFLPES